MYAEYVLIKSYLALKGKDKLLLPQETSALYREVYGDEMDEESPPAGLKNALQETRAAMVKEQRKAKEEAKNRLILKPNDEDFLYRRSPGLEEDSPELHASFQALTRLSDRSISLVCLHEVSNELNTEPDGSGTSIDLTDAEAQS